MTQNFKKYLKIANGERELASEIPDSVTIRIDGTVQPVRELLIGTDIQSTNLIQTEVLRTVTDGAEAVKCFRNALPIYTMTSNSMIVNVGSAGSYAPEVAEGAEVPNIDSNFTAVTFAAKKRAVRPMITRELMKFGAIDLIEFEIAKAGKRVENSLNQKALTVMLDGASLEKDTAGTNQGVAALAASIALVQDAGFLPDSVVMHPEFLAKVLAEFVPGQYDSSVRETGIIGRLLGLDVYVCGATGASTTYTWGYAADGEIGAIVFAKDSGAAIGMAEDLSVEQFEDPIRDMSGMIVKSIFDVKVLNSAAICRIEY